MQFERCRGGRVLLPYLAHGTRVSLARSSDLVDWKWMALGGQPTFLGDSYQVLKRWTCESI
jgi:hypothetical protein